jgi:hypothetical protein
LVVRKVATHLSTNPTPTFEMHPQHTLFPSHPPAN